MLLASAVSQQPCSSHERPRQLCTMHKVIGRVALHQMAKWCSIRSLKRRRSFGCLSWASKYPTSWTKTRTWLTSAVISLVWKRIDASRTLSKAQTRASRLCRRVIARQASSPNSWTASSQSLYRYLLPPIESREQRRAWATACSSLAMVARRLPLKQAHAINQLSWKMWCRFRRTKMSKLRIQLWSNSRMQ